MTDEAREKDIDYYAKVLHTDKVNIVLTATPKDSKPTGIDALEEKISNLFLSGAVSKDDVFISNDRQKDALIKAKNAAENMLSAINDGMPNDMLYIDLEELVAALGEVTGVTVQEEIIDKVFERFCVGK